MSVTIPAWGTRAIFFSLGLAAAAFAGDGLAAPAIDRSVDSALRRIYENDRPHRVDVVLRERRSPEDGMLFEDLPDGEPLDPSYEATYDFCQRFDPYNKSDNEVSDAEIRAYLETLAETGPLLEAFFVTGNDSLEDLAKVWFRGGRGFEHVVCGEGSRGKLGGYHFWYMQYRYEREGSAVYQGADYGSGGQFDEDGMADPALATGKMSWDPDGPGGERPLAKKPRGGFSVGNSVSALLAVGHLLAYGQGDQSLVRQFSQLVRDPDDDQVFTQDVIQANLSGRVYPWTVHMQGKSLRTLWPRWVPEGFGFTGQVP